VSLSGQLTGLTTVGSLLLTLVHDPFPRDRLLKRAFVTHNILILANIVFLDAALTPPPDEELLLPNKEEPVAWEEPPPISRFSFNGQHNSFYRPIALS
jgi:hypothetical protein